MSTGRKVNAGEAAELLAQWQRSGERMSRWCGERGISWYSLSAYKGWLTTRRDGEVDFAELVVEAAPEPPPARYRVEVGAFVVEVDDHFQTETLRRLLWTVARC